MVNVRIGLGGRNLKRGRRAASVVRERKRRNGDSRLYRAMFLCLCVAFLT